ncbi:f6d69ea9-11a8-4ff5-9db9-11e8153c5e2e [Thermothielavioides terrestris]|jgi:hypothetical protein
MVRL